MSGSDSMMPRIIATASSGFPSIPISRARESSLKTTIFSLGSASFLPASLAGSVNEPT